MRVALFSFAWILAWGPAAFAGEPGAGIIHVMGHYTDSHLANYGRLTLPRTFLYNSKNQLVAATRWPRELKEVKRNMGDAFCCVSDDNSPRPANGPPADCVKIIYGENVSTNFDGLLDPSGNPIVLSKLPAHRYLLVEYAAKWCAPCVLEGKAIGRFFNTAADASDYIWVTIDMTRIIDAQSRDHSPN
jgi:hypothetical protein